MVSSNLEPELSGALEKFSGLGTNDQLALLWFVYTKMGDSITPAAPDAASPDISEGLYDQVKDLSKDEQLQAQRNLLEGKDTLISREYGSLSANSKLLFWYRLAQGMEQGTIIPMPDDYKMASEGSSLLGSLENMDFEQQITFLRNVVAPAGSEPKSGAVI
ncbi:MAG: orange carotenoid protein N-terminal domain-containing protein [Cyanophyceae cyanobacterium]